MMKALNFVIALSFGSLFLWSGIGKVKDPISFAEAVRNYRIIGDPFAAAAALFIPWLEIFSGIAVMWDRMRQGAAALLTLLLLGFSTAIISAWIRGLDITCGCFGGQETMNYPVKIAQNLGLILAGVWLWWSSRGESVGGLPGESGQG